MNSIHLEGRLGMDPEVEEKEGKNGTFKIAKFSLAVDRDFGDQTDWFRCEVVGKRAEVIEKYFRKGKPIIVEGRMESYKTDRDNLIHWKVPVEKFWFEKGEGGEHKSTNEPNPSDSFESIDIDVPF